MMMKKPLVNKKYKLEKFHGLADGHLVVGSFEKSNTKKTMDSDPLRDICPDTRIRRIVKTIGQPAKKLRLYDKEEQD